MSDVLVYWRDYKQNWVRQFARERSHYWHSNSKVISKLKPGDRLWMVTSGESLRHAEAKSGFLVAIWTITKVETNPGDDPAYPTEEYRSRVIGGPDKSTAVEEPVLVDHILRPPGGDQAVSIGRFLQGPRRLSEEKVGRLLAAIGSRRQPSGSPSCQENDD
jgi:hypothetical protein